MTVCDCAVPTQEQFDDIHFSIEADATGGLYLDWTIRPVYAEETVPFSNLHTIEFISYEPAVVEWKLYFVCRHNYHAFLSRLGTVGTLTVFARSQSLKGVEKNLGQSGKTYEELDSVLLKYIDEHTHHVDGTISVRATFQRAVDPVTRLAV